MRSEKHRTGAPSFVLIAMALSTMLSGCTAAPGSETERPSSATATPGAGDSTTGLAAPWSVAFVGDTVLLSERDSGRILELAEDGSAREAARLDDIVLGGEGWLLGLAVPVEDDRGAASMLYAYSTGPDGNRVQRFALHGEPGSLSLGAAETVIGGLPSASNHNGGRIAFGPDGMLYVTVGDASHSELAQDRSSLAGKILRLTPDGDVPADNPFPGSPVFSYGHRNPQGIAWDEDGTMYATEFGQNTWDELNVITAGANYGWPTVEGIAHDERFTDPVQQWAPEDASPSGMAIADDTIYIANLRGERLRSVPLDDLGDSTEHLAGEYGRLRDIVLTPDGTLWALTNNTDGRGEPRPGDDRFFDTGLIR